MEKKPTKVNLRKETIRALKAGQPRICPNYTDCGTTNGDDEIKNNSK